MYFRGTPPIVAWRREVSAVIVATSGVYGQRALSSASRERAQGWEAKYRSKSLSKYRLHTVSPPKECRVLLSARVQQEPCARHVYHFMITCKSLKNTRAQASPILAPILGGCKGQQRLAERSGAWTELEETIVWSIGADTCGFCLARLYIWRGCTVHLYDMHHGCSFLRQTSKYMGLRFVVKK